MTKQEALQWVAGLFEESPEIIAPETPRDAIVAWDSLGVLTLMAALDERFGILLTEQDMRAMQKVDDILEVLRQRGKLN